MDQISFLVGVVVGAAGLFFLTALWFEGIWPFR